MRPPSVTYRDDADVTAALRTWQALLHLQDWELSARLVPQETFADDRSQVADCSVCVHRQAAEVRLATQETIAPDLPVASQDMERSLVHELLHVVLPSGRLWTKRRRAHELRAYEIGIEQLARTLVELHRGRASAP